MPDLLSVFSRWWKYILGITLVATAIALLISLLLPKEYLSTATALPANSLTSDKARIFNEIVQALYSDIGNSDDLDKFEGTAALDTIYIATVKDLNLVKHYRLEDQENAIAVAAKKLRRNSRISRTEHNELSIKVWDRDRKMAADIANSMLQNLQVLHQNLQMANQVKTLKTLQESYSARQQQYASIVDSGSISATAAATNATSRAAIMQQLVQDQKLIHEYEVSLRTNPEVLITVEPARPAAWSDRPQVLLITLLSFVAALAFSVLIALFMDSRKQVV
jgi:uncharacterized protein involved in exopolysaccharide biosynthesis